MRIWPIAEVESEEPGEDTPRLPDLRRMAEWSRRYLLKGHPELGRTGPVCPWCPPSVQRGHFYLTAGAKVFSDPSKVAAELDALRDEYLRIEPTSGPDLSLKTVLYVLEASEAEAADPALTAWMREVHVEAKPGFLSHGLMLGEFFPDNDKTGLRSDEFEPLSSPLPIFVVRDMVALDIAFLSERPEFAEAYFAKFEADAVKNLGDILHISPKRLAATVLRSLLVCLVDYDLQTASHDGRDLVSGAHARYLGHSRLRSILDQDRTFRSMVSTIVYEPAGLEDDIEVDSVDHLHWLWAQGHRLRQAVAEGFSFRDGPRLVAVLQTSDPEDVRRVIRWTTEEAAGIIPTRYGLATESVEDPHAEHWTWDGSERTSGAALLRAAYHDLRNHRARAAS